MGKGLFVNQWGKLLGGREVEWRFSSVDGNRPLFIILHHFSEG